MNAYFEDLYAKGYNVGLGVDANNTSGDVRNISVSTSWFIRPGVSYRIKPNLFLHGHLMYQQVKTSFEQQPNYRISDRRASYQSMSDGIKSNSQGLLNAGLGIRYYFGRTQKPAETAKPDPYAEMVKLSIKLQDERYSNPVTGNIEIKKGSKVVFSGKADQSGISNFYLEPGNYTVSVTAKGYIPAEENLQLQASEKGTSKVIDLKQPKIEKGLVFKLKTINFETGSNQLSKSSYDILDKLSAILKEYPQMVIEVAGHTDNVGNADVNMKLSQKRAASVVAYLVGKGVKSEQMKSVGYGETQPVASNDTEEGRLQNRRVMFTVLEF